MGKIKKMFNLRYRLGCLRKPWLILMTGKGWFLVVVVIAHIAHWIFFFCTLIGDSEFIIYFILYFFHTQTQNIPRILF